MISSTCSSVWITFFGTDSDRFVVDSPTTVEKAEELLTDFTPGGLRPH
jgi:hypothetical protein